MTNFDQQEAQAEGWGVFEAGQRDDGSARIEIQRFDDAQVSQMTTKLGGMS